MLLWLLGNRLERVWQGRCVVVIVKVRKIDGGEDGGGDGLDEGFEVVHTVFKGCCASDRA